MRITNHAEKRMKKRMGAGKKDFEKIAQKAIDFGIKHSEVRGNLLQFVNKVFLSHHKGANIRIYQQKVFVFTKDFVLITVLPVPSNLINTVNKISKKIKEDLQNK
jgi:hypothetical protein